MPGTGGLAVVEAMAAGLPVILGPHRVSGDGTVHELAVADVHAVYAADGSSESYMEAIRGLYSRLCLPGEVAKIGAACRDRYSERGGLERMCRAFECFVEWAEARSND